MTFGLTFLDELRPPPDYETSIALGTTYSLDLVTCAAAILALDGRSADEADVPVPAMLRALKRLQGKIHVVAQRGCIVVPDTAHAKIVSLLDRIVTGVALPGSRAKGTTKPRRTFHPKVWLVRHAPRSPRDESPVRWKLIVASRNLTSHDAWDLGVCFHGVVGKRRTNVPNVRGFAARVLELKGGRTIEKKLLQELDSVTWELPEGVNRVRFAWNEGAASRCSDDEGHPAGLSSDAEWLLVVSPFLSATAVRFVARRWGALTPENRWLVGGFDALEKVARLEPRALASMSPRFLDAIVPDAPIATEESTTAEVEEESRGLHAKAIAVWHDTKRATVMLGSPNLTVEGWHGANCEAWVLLEGDARVADELWTWAETRTREFNVERVGKEKPDKEAEVLDALRDAIARERFTLDDAKGVLRCISAETLGIAPGVSLVARRITQAPSGSSRWQDRVGVRLEPCEGAERTRFVAMTLRTKNGRVKSWVQDVDVTPPIDVARDEATFRELVSSSAHLWSYIWGVLDDAWLDGDGIDPPDGDDNDDARSGKRSSRAATDRGLWLEPLLASLARARAEDRLDDVLSTVDAAITSHRKGVEAGDGRQLDDRIVAFIRAWDAIREGLA